MAILPLVLRRYRRDSVGVSLPTLRPVPPAQLRRLCGAAFIDSLGDGLFLAGSALFFVRGLGLSIEQTGLGLSIAGILGLAIGARIGRIADRFGARDAFMAFMVGQAVVVGSYTLVSGIWSLVLAATVAAVLRQGAQASRGALLSQLAGQDAAQLRAVLHVWINVGIAGGAALAGLAIAADTHRAYLLLMLADAATFACAAGLSLTLPRGHGSGKAASRNIAGPLRDRPFMVMTALSGVVSLQFVVTGYLLPLWVVFHTDAPRWLASPLLLINTAVVVAMQVPTSRRFVGLARSATAYRWAGLALAGGCGLFAVSALSAGRTFAVATLVLAMLVISAGEVLSLAGAFTVSFGFAPDGAVGDYQGVWTLGFGTSVAVGPALLTLVCLRGGGLGWLVLAAVILSACWALAATADRTRQRQGSTNAQPARAA